MPVGLAQWHTFATRNDFCTENLKFLGQNETCAPQETFIDMCDMLELRQVCTTLRGAMQYFLRLNMARGGHLERTRMLYMPDRYMHGDGEFASTAVVSAYRDLAKDTGFECRDWRFSDELMSAELQSNDRVHRDECVEIFATTIIQRMNLLRQVVFGIVDLLMSISQLVLDVMMYLGLALFEASSQFLRSMRSDLGRAIVENGEALAAQFAELLKDIIDSIVQSVVDTFLTALQGAVQFLCSVFDTVRNIILAIIDFFRRAFNDDTFDQDELREDSVCYDFFEDLLGVFTAAEPAQSLIADQCFTATAGQPVDFPSGFFGAPQRRFTCGLTSMCPRRRRGARRKRRGGPPQQGRLFARHRVRGVPGQAIRLRQRAETMQVRGDDSSADGLPDHGILPPRSLRRRVPL